LVAERPDPARDDYPRQIYQLHKPLRKGSGISLIGGTHSTNGTQANPGSLKTGMMVDPTHGSRERSDAGPWKRSSVAGRQTPVVSPTALTLDRWSRQLVLKTRSTTRAGRLPHLSLPTAPRMYGLSGLEITRVRPLSQAGHVRIPHHPAPGPPIIKPPSPHGWNQETSYPQT